MARNECFLAAFSDKPCSGPLVRCHLIPRALMRREFRYGLILVGKVWFPALNPALEIREGQRWRLERLLHDERASVWGCGLGGGPGHHGELDVTRKLRIPRADLPKDVEDLAAQIGLVWWLDREYGMRDAA